MRSLLAIVLLVGCAPAATPVTGTGPGPGAAAPASGCVSQLPALGPANLCGRAEDAKSGAVVLLDDGAVVYIRGLESWPDELRKQRVEARGRLVKEKMIPDPPPPGEPQAQGAYGEQLVLDGASYKRAP